jgi:transglutaminase superfamily protein
MVIMRCLLTSLLLITVPGVLAAADKEVPPDLGEETTTKWRFGVVVNARGGSVTGIQASLPVPTDWPEQTVKIVAEDKSPTVRKISYRVLDGGVKQMLVAIPRLRAGEEAKAVITMEIAKRAILEPSAKGEFSIPAKPARELQKFLLPSPYIESRDPKFAQISPQILIREQRAWGQTEEIYKFVRDNVKYEFAEEIRPAIDALNDRKGDCEELSSIFIAICRASKIPARAVWVPGHCYPEFYLTDGEGRGHWFPCQAAGEAHEFGKMKEERPILQKGDNFKVPGEKEPQRYVKHTLSATNAEVPPEVKFVLERVKE